jgi:hypothetical protein
MFDQQIGEDLHSQTWPTPGTAAGGRLYPGGFLVGGSLLFIEIHLLFFFYRRRSGGRRRLWSGRRRRRCRFRFGRRWFLFLFFLHIFDVLHGLLFGRRLGRTPLLAPAALLALGTLGQAAVGHRVFLRHGGSQSVERETQQQGGGKQPGQEPAGTN